MQRNNGDSKDEEAEWAGDQQLQCKASVLDHPPLQSSRVPAKMKKPRGPEISSFSLSGSSKQQCDCKDEEAEQARDL